MTLGHTAFCLPLLEKVKIVPVVPLSWQPTALKANHDIISSGHQSIEKTLQRLKHTAYWHIGLEGPRTRSYTAGVVWQMLGCSCIASASIQ